MARGRDINAELHSLLIEIDRALIALARMLTDLGELDDPDAQALRHRAREFLSAFAPQLERLQRWSNTAPRPEERPQALQDCRETVEGLAPILREFQKIRGRD